MSKQSKKNKKKKGPSGPKTPVQPVQKNVMVDGYVKKVQPPKKSGTKQETPAKPKRNTRRVLFVTLTVLILWGLFYWGAGFFNKNLFHRTKVDSTTISVQPTKDSVAATSKTLEPVKQISKKPPPKVVPKKVTTKAEQQAKVIINPQPKPRTRRSDNCHGGEGGGNCH